MPQPIDVDGLAVQTADLDDVFLSLTGDHDPLREAKPSDDHLSASPSPIRRRCCGATCAGCAAIPSLTLFIAGTPVVFLLLFVYVFGGTMGAGLGGAAGVAGGRDQYLAYVLPGILLITIAGAAQGTALSVAMDMSEGIVARFRTMAVARTCVLAGHVVGSVIQTMLALAIVIAFAALLIGFRADDGAAEWLGGGRPARRSPRSQSRGSRWRWAWSPNNVETASNLPMFLILLPFLSSGFVPTDSMPGGLAGSPRTSRSRR